jgi:VanZ family protein
MKTVLKYYAPTFLWTIVIFILCSIKIGEVSHSHLFFAGFDKLVHCGLYFVLVVFYSTDFIKKHGPAGLTYAIALLIIIAAILYGGAIELLQAYIFTWRSGEWADLFADAVGACMGIFSVLLMLLAIKHVKK